ncbi:hypothetical protein LGQ02_16900 [Bacillus shivajii]|uniref:hypothetical protein n=1 Tax=Bacillus shivajii TaxID=1983719 RepID=UPI001CFC0CB6|nr:hypothetical protein [Bacillus shivajii]UCZ52498.1 hypothetical protein LGQ02_16900 [Bacillus shivajii]
MTVVPLVLSAVTRSSPSFHNPGHIRMWYDSPLRNFEPHLVTGILLLIILAGIGYFIYFQLKQRNSEQEVKEDASEKAFEELVARKNILMNKLLELEEAYESGELKKEEYEDKEQKYKQYLLKVKKELNQYLE